MMSAGVFCGCVTNPVTGREELMLISTEQEISMGDEAAPEAEKEYGGLYDNSEVQYYVQRIGNKLAAVSDRKMPYKFAVLDSKIANAFALPGGRIYITTTLIREMGSSEELAAVLGHEIGHVAALHHGRMLTRQLGAAVLVALAAEAGGADNGESAGRATQIAAAMLNLKYGRDEEYQADTLGIRYLSRAGYNPWAMVTMLEKLDSLNKSEPGFLGDLLSTHPLTSRRIQEAGDTTRYNYAGYPETTQDPDATEFGKILKIIKGK